MYHRMCFGQFCSPTREQEPISVSGRPCLTLEGHVWHCPTNMALGTTGPYMTLGFQILHQHQCWAGLGNHCLVLGFQTNDGRQRLQDLRWYWESEQGSNIGIEWPGNPSFYWGGFSNVPDALGRHIWSPYFLLGFQQAPPHHFSTSLGPILLLGFYLGRPRP